MSAPPTTPPVATATTSEPTTTAHAHTSTSEPMAPTDDGPRNAQLTVTALRACRRVSALPTDLATAARERSGSGEREDAEAPITQVRNREELEAATKGGERPAQGCCARCGRTGALMYFDGRLAIMRPRAERVDDTG
jgi:hypothetical protein